jgi:hypothetical protein
MYSQNTEEDWEISEMPGKQLKLLYQAVESGSTKKPRLFPNVENRTLSLPHGALVDFPVGWGLCRLCRLCRLRTVEVLFNRPFVLAFGDSELDWQIPRRRNEIDLLGPHLPRLVWPLISAVQLAKRCFTPQ